MHLFLLYLIFPDERSRGKYEIIEEKMELQLEVCDAQFCCSGGKTTTLALGWRRRDGGEMRRGKNIKVYGLSEPPRAFLMKNIYWYGSPILLKESYIQTPAGFPIPHQNATNMI